MPTLRRAAWRVAAILLLSVVTLAAFSEPFRFTTVGSIDLPVLDSRLWVHSAKGVRQIVGPPDTIALTPAAGFPFTFALTRFRAIEGVRNIRISADFRTDGVVAGRADWQRARIILWSYDQRGRRMIYLPHDVVTEQGTEGWRRFALTVPVLPRTRSFSLLVAHAGVAGTAMMRDLKLETVAETTLFKLVRRLLIVIWVGVGCWTVYPLVRGADRPMHALAMVCAAAILVAALTPQPYFSDFTTGVARTALDGARSIELAERDALDSDTPPVAPKAPAPGVGAGPSKPPAPGGTPQDHATSDRAPVTRSVRTIAWQSEFTVAGVTHFAGFLTLGALVALGYAGVPVPLLLAVGSVFAVATETLQSFEITRTPQIGDLAVDLGGLVCGLVIVLAGRAVARLWRKRLAPGA